MTQSSFLEEESSCCDARCFDDIYAEFNDPNGRTLIVAHRGDWRRYPENSVAAVQSCIEMGIDMVEIDVRQTKDGHLVLMHDKTVDRMTNGSGKVAELTLAEIQTFYLRDGKGGGESGLTSMRVARLEEVMILAKGSIMINLDKCWDVREAVYEVLVKTDTLAHGLFKSSAHYEEVAAFLQSKTNPPEYMHVVEEENFHELPMVLSQAQPKAIELVFPALGSPMLTEESFEPMRGKQRIWCNSIQASLCGGHPDEEPGWEWMTGYGFNMIQTDCPERLKSFLELQHSMRIVKQTI
ncbi:glycerophosphodiester phosphodiesterase family protein [Paenibacillus sp. NPDC056579]|uniref:glycerophosphodiester phosphodiesterase family protein n=1 Tax=Paenibacillus sp. NPDC056579 TaxID=3345871 RepID=UPI003681BD31